MKVGFHIRKVVRLDCLRLRWGLGMKTQIIGPFAAKTHFFGLLEQARKGAIFIVTKRGQPVAQLGPTAQRNDGPVFGRLAGRLHMEATFDYSRLLRRGEQ